MEELKCPHCGSDDIEENECHDTETIFDFNRGEYVVIKYFNGQCPDCKSILNWEKVYSFMGYQNIVKQ